MVFVLNITEFHKLYPPFFVPFEYNKGALTLFPLGYFEDLSPLGGGGGADLAPPQISATKGPIDSKIGTVVKQVK